MAGRGLALLFAVLASAASAQPAVQPSAIDRARITASPAVGQAIAVRTARWTLANSSGQPITMIRLRPDGAASFGPNLLTEPLPNGATTTLVRPAAPCMQTVELRLTSGATQSIRQDLCDQPQVRAPAPPRAPAAISRPPAISLPVQQARPPAPPPPPLPPAVVERPVTIGGPAPTAPSIPRNQATTPGSAGVGTVRPARPIPTSDRPATATPLPASPPLASLPESPSPAPARAPEPTDAIAAPATESSDPVPIAAQAGDAGTQSLVWCPELEEELPAIVCERLKQVERGVAGVSAPKTMIVGETRMVRLVVSRAADSAAVADALGGPDAVSREFGLPTGRYMEARLTGSSGLQFTPDDWVRRDLGAGDMEDWEWQVTALAAGRHQVMLQTRVMTRLADGSFVARDRRPANPQYVDVTVTATQRLESGAGIVNRWLAALAAPTESLTNLLTLLATMVAAAAGLWAAIRGFGRKSRPDNSEED